MLFQSLKTLNSRKYSCELTLIHQVQYYGINRVHFHHNFLVDVIEYFIVLVKKYYHNILINNKQPLLLIKIEILNFPVLLNGHKMWIT